MLNKEENTQNRYDIIIIGAGIIGTTIAYELSKYPLRILIIEKQNDIANGATMANSAIVHAGYDPVPGTLKAKFNVQGCMMMEEYCKTLDVLYLSKPSLVVAFKEEEMEHVTMLYERGLKNGVKDLQILNQEQLRAIEPNISDEAVGCLYAPTSAIFEPWGLAIAAMEVAMENGVELALNTITTAIHKDTDYYNITTNKGNFLAKTIINCAGCEADEIHNLIAEPSFVITPRKGHYFVLDEPALSVVNNILFPCPSEKGKGILLFPAIHSKLLIGPDSEFVEDKQDLSCDAKRLDYIRECVRSYVKQLPYEYIIRSFAGNRPTSDKSDFIIQEVQAGFFDVAGIESPGLTSAPAIAKYVEQMVIESCFQIEPKSQYQIKRKNVIRFKHESPKRQQELLEENPGYGSIVCRCEKVTEAEVVDAIHRKCGAFTIKGVKKRVGCGLGRCQGGFCEAKIIDLLAQELNIAKNEVRYDGEDSYVLLCQNKNGGNHHA